MALNLQEESKEALKKLVSHFGRRFERDQFVEPLEEIDRYYHMESHETMNRKDKKEDEEYSERYEKTDLPIVREQVKSETPFYERIFLDELPIFSVARNKIRKELKAAAAGINAKIETDQTVCDWKLNLSRFLHDCAKYNLGAVSCIWDAKTYTSFKENGQAELATTEVQWTGNRIKYINPYNLIFDQTVDPSEVAEFGEYAGYIEFISQGNLYQEYLKKQGNENAFINGSTELWESSTSYQVEANLDYKIPDITKRLKKKDDETDWVEHSGVPIKEIDFKDLGNPNRHYHVTRLYCRIIPAQLNINGSTKEADEKVQIWEIIIVNGSHLFYAAPVNNAHNLLPILLCQPEQDTLGIQGKSGTQCVTNIQHLSQQLMEKRLAALDRSVNDRGIFDGGIINKEQFKKRIPDGKIEARLKGNKTLRDAYLPLDFRDNTVNINAEIQGLQQISMRANLSNQSRTGQFVKGNKTPDEFRQTTANAEAPLLSKASQINEQVMEKLKKIIKFNLLQYGQPEELYSVVQEGAATFDPRTLLETSIEFKLAGGLSPLATAMNSGELDMLFNIAQTNPMIAQMYDIFGIFEDAFYSKGIDLEKYRMPPQPAAPAQGAQVPGQAAPPTGTPAPEQGT